MRGLNTTFRPRIPCQLGRAEAQVQAQPPAWSSRPIPGPFAESQGKPHSALQLPPGRTLSIRTGDKTTDWDTTSQTTRGKRVIEQQATPLGVL